MIVEPALEPVALGLERRLVLDGHLLGVRQLVDDQLGDLSGCLGPAPAPLRDQRGDGFVDGRARVGSQLAKGLEQAEPLVEAHRVCVEVAHDLEVLVQGPAPFGGVVLRADPIDERHAGLPGPTEDLHLRLVVAAERAGAVHDVEDVRARQDGREEPPLVEEVGRSFVGAQELGHARRPVGRGHLSRPQPGERAGRVLEPGCVDQHEERPSVHADRILPDFGGGAGAGIDAHRVVLRERRHDARLALVHPTHHGEPGRIRHGAPRSGSTAR